METSQEVCNISYLHCLCATVCSVHTVFWPELTSLDVEILDKAHRSFGISKTISWGYFDKQNPHAAGSLDW